MQQDADELFGALLATLSQVSTLKSRGDRDQGAGELDRNNISGPGPS
jgi:hypothetical protein